MENLKTVTYKGFKIIPVTEKIKEKYSLYSCVAKYIIINLDNEYEWEIDNINEAKEWIDSY